MSPIDDHRDNCDRQHTELTQQLGVARSAGRRQHLHTAILANRYGCGPGHRWAGLLRKDGTPRTGAIDPAPAPVWLSTLGPRGPFPAIEVDRLSMPTDTELRISDMIAPEQWTADTNRTAAKRLHKEIRGVTRALWLYLLWSGADVSTLRSSYYHHEDVAPYWPWAWKLLQNGDCLDRLLCYLRGLLWAWSLRSGHKSHAGEAFLCGVEALIMVDAGEVAA